MEKISIIRTSKDRLERFSSLAVPAAEPAADVPPHDATVIIDTAVEYQEIIGFGGAFTESAGTVWQKLSAAKRAEVVNLYFSAEEGNGYNLCRTHMNSCDFSLGNYACCDTPGDVELKTFTIDRERKNILPFLHAAQKCAGADNLKLFISPWSPPAWMKDSRQMNAGGKLLPEYRDVWARYYCRFIEELGKEKIPVWGLTIQNEPIALVKWDSCFFTAEEEGGFVRDHLGPALAKAGLADCKVMVWDHNRFRLFDRLKSIYADPEAAKYIWGAAYHWYADECFDNLLRSHEAFPDKHLLFSEGCHEGCAWLGEWAIGERYAHNMINDFNNWSEGWVDWNLVLDDQGGPNHVGNYCSAPVMVDAENDRYMLQSSYYYIGHFSRFVKRGARRVLSCSSRDALEATAFRNPDGSRVAVILNRSAEAISLYLKEGEKAVKLTLPAHSIETVVIA